MTVSVDIDLASAAISLRPAAGEERSLTKTQVSVAAILSAQPWRTFRWYFGQRQPVDSSADMSLNGDDSHRLSISGQSVWRVPGERVQRVLESCSPMVGEKGR